MDPVYRTVVGFARTLFAVQGLKFTVSGHENIPDKGGAVVAINHTGYLDFAYSHLPARSFKRKKNRYIRFMAKKAVFDNAISGPIMRGCKHIPVDREAGAGAYAVAVERLQAGELIGMYPEATISRSFEIKHFKSGTARMALEAGVPIIPVIVWGAQRVWTKGQPKHMGRTKTPIVVMAGTPLQPEGSAEELTATLHQVMADMLAKAQQDYPMEPGAYWVPARLGGSAPTLEEANKLDEAEVAERRAKREAKGE
ncbi:lysophospholipid acyltransferase family protein [Smaragdicoccus niigatensis]|uniref:lysophospholipid acyltransferase family protein n=1 Tax=Smaragdicoccus niigatensis TaxID=359359 RepID=UPI000371FB62|nr:lysophospholipid acyltransferase family protein [Smaragdicoccus niigatensis]